MRNVAIGDIQDWGKSEHGIRFSCHGFSGNIQCCSSKTFRIRIRKEGNSPKGYSYAVNAEAASKEFKLEDSESVIELITPEATLSISVSPFRITLKDAQGNVLSQDDQAFGTSALAAELTTYRKLQKNERFIGLGEKVGPVDRRGQAYTNYNTDKFAYSIDEDPLYLSIPFFIGIHDQGIYGLFLDNNHKSRFNFGASTQRFSWFSAANGEMDYYLIAGQTVAEVITEYTLLTGRMAMPPRWALGYQQCRYSYYPDHEVSTLALTFRDKDIPADVIYLDIHYMEGFKAFTFDKTRFPDPVKMNKELRKQGFRTVAIVDPGIKVEKGYGTYDRGVKADVFAKLPDGERYQGEVWPSWSHFPDFTDPSARDWWGEEISFYPSHGVSGIWNDMNEPAAWGQCLPELIEFNNEGHPTSHAEVRNVYGMQMARATQEGMRKHMTSERPFILTRAGFAGIQRHSAVWTGDNVSSDDHLLLSCRMLCSLGLSGIPFAGNDIGGFAGEASPSLFARWISVGVFQPMCRAHTQVNTRDAEPWSFGEEVEQIARNYIKLRYRLMPYIYTAFRRAVETGLPVMRSMAMAHPKEDSVYDLRFENQYYFGENLLICPARSTQETIEIYLPEGQWYDLFTDKIYAGGKIYFAHCPLHKLPVFVKAGAVLPWMSQTSHAEQAHDGILRLHVYKGKASEGGLYEDDGISHAHEEGSFLWRTWKHHAKGLDIEKAKGSFKSSYSKIELILHGFESKQKVEVNGKSIGLSSDTWTCTSPISGIDTFFKDKGSELGCDVLKLNMPLSKEPQKIRWS